MMHSYPPDDRGPDSVGSISGPTAEDGAMRASALGIVKNEYAGGEMTTKYAIITGASRGLGKQLALRYWEAGYDLGLVARDVDALSNTVAQLPAVDGRTCDLFDCDLGDSGAIGDLLTNISDKERKVSTLVNNAAIQGPIGPLEENDLREWRRAIDVNLVGPVAMCRGLVGSMSGASDATIINLSGGGATGPRANFTAYACAKAALVRFSETLAQEVMSRGITVNCIAPGAMKTSMLAKVLDSGVGLAGAREVSIAERVFEEGGASLDRVADLALFLSSPKARGITGKLISSVWDKWEVWPEHLDELSNSDLYTLRRIAGRDRGRSWGDK
jgi:NAD(P)-dependent dehydrogenase (short-subunit alcohol dehydrogenase family)